MVFLISQNPHPNHSNCWSHIVMNSYIALRLFYFLFIRLFFTSFDIYHCYHSWLASEFYQISSENKRSFLRSYFISIFAILSFFSTLGGTITSHHMLLRFYNKRTLINRGESGWTLRTPPLGTRHRSNKATISFGVPQVSVLGPLLFFLYVNNFHPCSTKLKFYLFADDTNILLVEQKWKFLKRLWILNWLNSTTGLHLISWLLIFFSKSNSS